MMMSGLMWTYAIGSVTAIATTLNPNATLYQTTMDSLNYFMRERDLPRSLAACRFEMCALTSDDGRKRSGGMSS